MRLTFFCIKELLLLPCLLAKIKCSISYQFNSWYALIMRNARLYEVQAGIRIDWINISNLRYTDDTTLMAESKEELNSLLMKVKEESEKVGLKVGFQRTQILASSPIISWQINGEMMGTETLFWGGSKITADGDCSHEIKRYLLLGRKAMTNLDSILKTRDITLPTKVRLVKAMVFPAVTCECESWAIKNAECRRIDAFELWCWRRLLRVLWTALRSNQSILKELSPKYSLEGLMLKLKLQDFGHLMQRTDSLEKTSFLPSYQRVTTVWNLVYAVTHFFLGSKIIVDNDCSLEIKRRLLLGRKAMTNLDSILKSRDISLPAKVHLVQGMFFTVAKYWFERVGP